MRKEKCRVLFKFEQIKNQTGNVEKGENQLKLNIQKESPRYMHLVKIKPFYNDKFDLFVRIKNLTFVQPSVKCSIYQLCFFRMKTICFVEYMTFTELN